MNPRSPVQQTVEIVAAYVARHSLSLSEIPALVADVHGALLDALGQDDPEPEVAQKPATTIRRSIQTDHLVCLEDGRKMISLKRHLRAKYGLSPEAYRAKWGLPRDYPMVAPAYSLARSNMAKAQGLGAGGRQFARGARKPKA